MIYSNIILPEELLEWINDKKEFQLIDISDDNLLKVLCIESEWIPGYDLLNHISELKKNIPIVLSCRVGSDSFIFMNILIAEYQIENVFSLKSGFYGLEKLIQKQD